MRKIPVGIQDFKKLRDEDYYYVDKSDLIAQILDGGAEVYLFTRPRRFGKSLNLSMMDAFLNVKHKGNTWFDGLKISERDDLGPRKNASPVLYFDFKDLNVESYDMFILGIRNKVARLFDSFRDVIDENTSDLSRDEFNSIYRKASDIDTLSRSFRILTDLIQEHHGKKAVALIDEYDNPIRKAYGRGDFRRILDFMETMIGSLFRENESLDFTVMMSMMHISKGSMSRESNRLHINDVLSTGSDEMFAFTPDEVRRLCEDCGHPEKYEETKMWYGGHIFGDAEVFDPWFVMNYLGSEFTMPPFWADTCGYSLVKHLTSKRDDATSENLRVLASGGTVMERIYPNVVYGDLHSDPATIYSMMVMAGYLRAVPKGSCHELSIPNRHLFGIFAEMLARDLISGSSSLYMFADSIVSCDTRMMSSSLYEMMSDAVGYRVLDNEHSYQAFITGVLMYLSGRYRVTADMEAGNGYYDIRLERIVGDGPNILIEIKRRRDSDGSKRTEELAEEALAQIKGKDYIHGLKGDTSLYGVAFDGKLPSVIAERTVL